MTSRESFGLFIESAGGSPAAEALRARAGEAAVETARAAWSGKILTLGTSRHEIEAALGKPQYDELHWIGYELPQKTGYLYAFEFEPAEQHLIRSGYRRLESAKLAITPPTSAGEWDDVSRQLSAAGTTLVEVEALLGKPTDHYGWWPIETWQYPYGEITFCNAIVVNEESR